MIRRAITKKTCKACGEKKTAMHFYRSSANRDGLNSRCKPCYEKFRKAKKSS